jgi:hypothetical protein
MGTDVGAISLFFKVLRIGYVTLSESLRDAFQRGGLGLSILDNRAKPAGPRNFWTSIADALA